MLKLEIKLDDDKVEKEGKYTTSGIYGTVDKVFSQYDFNKEILSDGTHCYYGNGKPKDYGIFGKIITSLKNKEWFIDYLSKWLWYNSDDGEDDEDYSIEDVLYHYTNRKSMA